MIVSGFSTSTSLSTASSTTSAVFPINAPDNPDRATVPITVTAAPSLCTMIRNQHIRRAFLDMQVLVIDVELGLKRLALLAIAGLDGFAELQRRVGRRQHRRRMGADHVQMGLGQAGDVITVIDDAGVQGAVFAIGIADVDRRQNHPAGPGFRRF